MPVAPSLFLSYPSPLFCVVVCLLCSAVLLVVVKSERVEWKVVVRGDNVAVMAVMGARNCGGRSWENGLRNFE